MTSKAAVLEYVRQQYPQWILGETTNSIFVEKDGERVTTGLRGRRNLDDHEKAGKVEHSKEVPGWEGLSAYRWIPNSQVSPLRQELHALLNAELNNKGKKEMAKQLKLADKANTFFTGQSKLL